MTIYECPSCKFVSVDGVKVRDNGGMVLKEFIDSKGVVHKPEAAAAVPGV